jgi:Tol biopolymer transport system component
VNLLSPRLPFALTALARAPACCATRPSADLIAFSTPATSGRPRAAAGARLTATPTVETEPYFSPDGSKIAYTATVGGNTDVYVMPTAGGDRRANVPSRRGPRPRLDADGKRVVFGRPD